MTERDHIQALIRSNDQLRAALIMAGKALGKREIAGLKHKTMLQLMRDAVADGRKTVKAARSEARSAAS